MNAILLDSVKPGDRCTCCGELAEYEIRCQGPEADPKVKMTLCKGCSGLLSSMLAADLGPAATYLRTVV